MRRLISDTGKSLEELLSLARSTGAPQSDPSPTLPVERLTNFMDVCAQMLYPYAENRCICCYCLINELITPIYIYILFYFF